jgi:UTP--glucose-1-phosphate uridylyltransferase
MPHKITKAILPVAGLGTRFLPATLAQPKEMLPVYDTPGIQYIVEGAVAAGITDIIMVTGKDKRALEDHFDRNFNLESTLEKKGKQKELDMVKKISQMANFAFVRQAEPLGDGHALLQAKPYVGEDESVVVLFGDGIMVNKGGKNSVQQMIETYNQTGQSVVSLSQVPADEVNKFGVADFETTEQGLKLKGFVEKPTPEEAPSDLVANGQYIITPEVFNLLAHSPAGKDGEYRLANALLMHIQNGGTIYGQKMAGEWFDTGDKFGFLKATIHFAIEHGGLGQELSDYIRSKISITL